jgi:hypothetical protein
MNEPALDRLALKGTIKSYTYTSVKDFGGPYECLDITFPNGETLHIHSTTGSVGDSSYLSISLE